MLKVVQEKQESNENGAGVGGGSSSVSLLDELVRDAARQMLAVALQAEVTAYIEAHVDEVDERGRRLVVRNGHGLERDVVTAAGPVTVKAPRVNDKRLDAVSGQRKRFASAILCRPGHASRRGWPKCCRCSTCTACPPTTSPRR